MSSGHVMGKSVPLLVLFIIGELGWTSVGMFVFSKLSNGKSESDRSGDVSTKEGLLDNPMGQNKVSSNLPGQVRTPDDYPWYKV